MRSRLLLGALAMVALFTAVGVASDGSHASPRQWAIVKFTDPVALRGHVLMGTYLIVHDDERMARNEPCTSIYAFDFARGPQALDQEFMCEPAQRAICEKTTFTVRHDATRGINRVTAYQFAGDSELHGVPAW
ncbi:MAG TPA: hypothetical protein VH497_11870 [Vicinamibacterales bacterium]|jgi:hypothetical protein